MAKKTKKFPNGYTKTIKITVRPAKAKKFRSRNAKAYYALPNRNKVLYNRLPRRKG